MTVTHHSVLVQLPNVSMKYFDGIFEKWFLIFMAKTLIFFFKLHVMNMAMYFLFSDKYIFGVESHLLEK